MYFQSKTQIYKYLVLKMYVVNFTKDTMRPNETLKLYVQQVYWGNKHNHALAQKNTLAPGHPPKHKTTRTAAQDKHSPPRRWRRKLTGQRKTKRCKLATWKKL